MLLQQNIDLNFICTALIELSQRVQLSPYILPAPLPDNCEAPENVNAVVIGNGYTSNNSTVTNHLQYAHLRTLPQNDCHKEFPAVLKVDSIICAANKPYYQSICFGDSGGPLVTQSDSTIIGVANFVKPGRID